MGKVLYIGVSEWTAHQIQDGHDLAEQLGIHLISNQPQYSMLWRVIEGDVVPVCVSLGISQVVFSPIAQGVLSGKYCPGEQPPTGSRATDENGGADIIMRWTRDDILERVQQLVALAKDAGLSMVQLAVAWVLQNENVASAIISASRPEQVQDNAAAAGVKLNDDLMTKIDEILDPVVERDPARTLDSSPKTREAVCPFLLRELKLRSSSAHATPRRAWARSRDRHYSVPCLCTFWPASLHLRGFSWPKRVGKLPCLSGTESGPEILRSSGQGHK